MPNLRVHAFGISVDGYGAGPNQSLENPLGVGGMALHDWVFPTRTFQRMFGTDDGTTGVDDEFAARGFDNIGAWILGRNMFGPVRGPWPDETWKGWWGENPPYHTPVFVLTHHARNPISMAGQTTLPPRQTEKIFGSGEVSQPSSSFCALDLLTMSISPSRRPFSGRASSSSRISTCSNSVTDAPSTCPRQKRPT
jgi:dihydrofolate reductase